MIDAAQLAPFSVALAPVRVALNRLLSSVGIVAQPTTKLIDLLTQAEGVVPDITTRKLPGCERSFVESLQLCTNGGGGSAAARTEFAAWGTALKNAVEKGNLVVPGGEGAAGAVPPAVTPAAAFDSPPAVQAQQAQRAFSDIPMPGVSAEEPPLPQAENPPIAVTGPQEPAPKPEPARSRRAANADGKDATAPRAPRAPRKNAAQPTQDPLPALESVRDFQDPSSYLDSIPDEDPRLFGPSGMEVPRGESPTVEDVQRIAFVDAVDTLRAELKTISNLAGEGASRADVARIEAKLDTLVEIAQELRGVSHRSEGVLHALNWALGHMLWPNSPSPVTVKYRAMLDAANKR